MKKIKLLLVCLIVFPQVLLAIMGAGDVVYDPAAAADRNKKTLMDKVHQRFMQTKQVQQLKMIVDNYNEGKKHYDYMKKIKEHKGGVVGYYKEKTVDRFKNFDEELLDGIKKDMNTNPTKEERKIVGENWFLDTRYKKFNEAAGKKLDFTKEINDLDKRIFEKQKKEAKALNNKIDNTVDNVKDTAKLNEAKNKLHKDAEKLKSQNDYDKWDVKSQMIMTDYLKKLVMSQQAQAVQNLNDEKEAKEFDDKIQTMLRAGLGNITESMIRHKEQRRYDPIEELGRLPQGDRR